ncbi:hypothetical protein M8494_22650 [Serratia ureilytica]
MARDLSSALPARRFLRDAANNLLVSASDWFVFWKASMSFFLLAQMFDFSLLLDILSQTVVRVLSPVGLRNAVGCAAAWRAH